MVARRSAEMPPSVVPIGTNLIHCGAKPSFRAGERQSSNTEPPQTIRARRSARVPVAPALSGREERVDFSRSE